MFQSPTSHAGFALLNEEREFLLRHVRMNRAMTRGDGVHLYDADGTRYLDCLSQYGAASFGHSPEFVWDAIRAVGDAKQASFVQPFLAPAAGELARELVDLMPFDFKHVVLCSTGTEAVEAALKMARAATGCSNIVSLSRGFHGKTHGSLLATGNPSYREPFLISSSRVRRVEAEDLEALEAALEDGACGAMIVEPVLGEGGMIPLSAAYLQAAAKLCRKYGTLIVADEIQTGLYRTGSRLASEQVPGFRPDIICLAKALGGGVVPIGAVLASADAWTEEFGLLHSSTFAGNQVSCAAALSVVRHLRAHGAELAQHVEQMSLRLERGLAALVAAYPDVFEGHSGKGLMRALRLHRVSGDDSYFIAHACEEGTFVPLVCGYLFHNHRLVLAPLFSQKDALRIEPPLIVEASHIEQLLRGIEECALLIRHRKYAAMLSFLVGREPAELSYSEKERRPISGVQGITEVTAQEEERLGSFAFLIHPPGEGDLMSMMPEAIGTLDEEHRREFLAWMESWFHKRHDPYPVYHAKRVRSKAGGFVEGWLIASPLCSRQMLRLSRDRRSKLIDGYLGHAAKLGVDIVGLGAFTSVVTRGGVELDRHGLNITTGNSLTAMAVADSLLKGLRHRHDSLRDLRVAVVGAAGSVGRIAAIRLSEECAHIVLIGNPANPRSTEKLGTIIGEIYAHGLARLQQGINTGLSRYLRSYLKSIFVVLNSCNQELLGGSEPDYLHIKRIVEDNLSAPPPVIASTALTEVLPQCQGVVSATSQGHAFIEASSLGAAAVVADAARPADLHADISRKRPDVLVYEGGLVSLPYRQSFGRANVLGFCDSVNLGCLSETIVLAMSKVKSSHSIGDRIPYAEAYRVSQLAALHGFKPCIATMNGEIDLDAYRPGNLEGSSR